MHCIYPDLLSVSCLQLSTLYFCFLDGDVSQIDDPKSSTWFFKILFGFDLRTVMAWDPPDFMALIH